MRLSLAIDRSASQAMLTVEDRGPGIADPKRKLHPFERGDASRSQGGAGLGLAIVARIVGRHAGTLEILPADGGGTRIVAPLPLLSDWQSANAHSLECRIARGRRCVPRCLS